MVNSCSAYGCTNRSVKNGISFHKFPLKDSNLLRRWVIATKRENFVPTKNSSLCSQHFVKENYNYCDANKPRLKANAVPSVFAFPERLQVKTACRKGPAKRRADEADDSPANKKLKILSPPVSVEDCLPVNNTNNPQTISPTKVKLRRKVKTLKQKLKRKECKIDSLAGIIKKLKDDQYITTDAAQVLDNNFSGVTCELFKSELKNKDRPAKGHRYTDEIKKFALTLHFYSPRAYNFVRSFFSLPCPSSLSNWTSSVNCEPGFFQDVFNYLQEKAKEDISYRDCALIFDGMYIKSGIVYNKSNGNYEGFANFGGDISAFDPDAMATEALVYMLVGLRGHWKIPVGYVLCNSINATNLSCLTSKALHLASSHGLRVHSVTCDGAPANLDSMRSFGCVFGKNLNDIKGSFSYEAYDHPLFFIPDACHMLKLARNALADVKIFVDDAKQNVKWSHIQLLHTVQEEEGLKFANRLAKGHIEFQRHKMNVKVAAQTLSSSVADAIEFMMKSGHPDFADAQGTIRFIRVIDQLFDLLNSRSPFGKGFKKPLFLHDSARWKSTVQKSISYLIKLSDKSGTPLIKHRRKTFVLGFIVALTSIRDLACLLLARSEHPFKYVLTYKCSQDHLELLFACIRGKNGFNNNPDVIQLKSSLRKILLRNAIVGSKHANCLTFEQHSAGSIFSLKWSRRRAPLVERAEISQEDSKYIKDLASRLESYTLTTYKEAILGYIAGYIVRKLSSKIHCVTCNKALF